MKEKDCFFYIGYSIDKSIRYKAASGGIGSIFIKYLLSTGLYGTAITFNFNKDKCLYEPQLIYDYENYNNCGSIYQDINIIEFIKNNLNNIQKGIIITCMPCQVRAIRKLLSKNNISSFIISFCCSGQTTVEGTWCYYKAIKIKKELIVNMQYRGNGWPSGIQIQLQDGTIIKKSNYSYPWTLIYQSMLFKPKRCFKCVEDISYISDISLADPWLEEYKRLDNIGHTMFIINTEKGENILEEMSNKDLIHIKRSSYQEYYLANGHTIQAKKERQNNKEYIQFLINLCSNSLYKKVFTYNTYTLKVHMFLIRIFHKLYNKK